MLLAAGHERDLGSSADPDPDRSRLVAFAFAGVDLARSAATAGCVRTTAQPKANRVIASFIISSSNLIHWTALR